MKIALINAPNKKFAMNKDLAGGIGQIWETGNSLFSKILLRIRKKYVNIPVLTLAYIQAILKKDGFYVRYFEGIPNGYFDLVFIYGTMIDYKNENNLARVIKRKYPQSKIGFIGPFVSKYPEYFKSDFTIIGEPESFFLYSFEKNKKEYSGIIRENKLFDVNDLPTPDFDGFPIRKYNYFPALTKKPLLTLRASHGCPYSCCYYCAYGSYQKQKYRIRTPEKIVEDILKLKRRYNIKSIQFRDPTFGIDKKQVEKMCNLITLNRIKIEWGIETRIDLLNKEIIKKMYHAGLRNINVGIETIDEEIANKNKRKLAEIKNQEEIIEFCKKIGVKISAFYIFGYDGDTEKSIKKLIDYSIKLNTNGARFAISTPFPGTLFFERMKKEKRLKTLDFKKYNSFELVFKHDNLSKEELNELKEIAFKRYYLRPKYFLEFLRWKIKEF